MCQAAHPKDFYGYSMAAAGWGRLRSESTTRRTAPRCFLPARCGRGTTGPRLVSG
jgi:hypothetical protein